MRAYRVVAASVEEFSVRGVDVESCDCGVASHFPDEPVVVSYGFDVGPPVGGCHDLPTSVGQPGLERSRIWASLSTGRDRAAGLGLDSNDQAQPVCGDKGLSEVVVAGALLGAVDAADGHAVGFVEVRHRLAVLALVVFDHEAVLGPVSVDRQCRPAAVGTGIAAQPLEPVLSDPSAVRISSHRSRTEAFQSLARRTVNRVPQPAQTAAPMQGSH
jgi:hypothetical protein